MESFVYNRIDNEAGPDLIRLLLLLPGKYDDPIRCYLRMASLKDYTHYEAISYCWEGQKPVVPIVCNDRRLVITQNLADALRETRKARCDPAPIFVWADAICINQEDDVEKSSQVKLMRDIYLHSAFTHIWLGEDSPNRELERAFTLIKKLVIARELQLGAGKATDLVALRTDRERHRYGIPAIGDPAWSSFNALLARPWFRRVWVIQEALFSKSADMVSKSLRLSFKVFHNVIIYCSMVGISEPFSNKATEGGVIPMLGCWNESQPDLASAGGLLELLLEQRGAQATDPRDKVYALLGLADDVRSGELNIVPDYSMDVNSVYVNTARELIHQSGNLDLLSVPRTEQHMRSGQPSWAPSWNGFGVKPAHPAHCQPVQGDFVFGFKATRDSICTPGFDNGALQLEGQVIDQITGIGAPMVGFMHSNPHANPRENLEVFSAQNNIFADWKIVSRCASDEPYINGQSIYEAYLSTITWNFIPEPFTVEAAKETDLFYERAGYWFSYPNCSVFYYMPWLHSTVLNWAYSGLESEVLNEPIKVDYKHFAQVNLATSCRRMVRTRNGYIGLVPHLAKAGDWVVVLKGAKVPHVLRKRGADWELIGDAYVHGIMNGEAFTEEECVPIRLV
jgi:hypothetical protein